MDNQTRLLIANWNERVAWDDTVFVLGDFAMGRIEKTLKTVPRFNGKKILIPGNHDRCWKGNGERKAALWRQAYLDAGFVAVIDKVDIYLGDYDLRLTMSHFPFRYEPDVTTYDRADKFYSYRPVDDGQWLLCGHCHKSWAEKDRMINVGVDVRGYYPMSLDEVLGLIDK